MSWGIVGGAVVGGVFASSAAGKASKAQAGAAAADRALQQEFYEKAEKKFAPYVEAGGRGLEEYERMIGAQPEYEGLIRSELPEDFRFGAEEFQQYKDPGYDFRLAEGERALNRGFGALGKRMSGERAAGLIDYGQRMGSQEFGAARGRAFQDYGSRIGREQEQYQRSLGTYGRQYTDPLAQYGSLADTGRMAVGGITGVGQQSATAQGAALRAGGEAQAAGTLGQYGAWTKAIGEIGGSVGGVGGLSSWGQSAPSSSWQYGQPVKAAPLW